jgi:Dolichyl-phosphate-mannose-protein mannosyltransferase
MTERWTGAFVILATAVVLLCWSWGTWPDVLVDFGQQLYIPWQLSEGKVLYRDLAYYNGPLSQYANAGLFRLFGVSLRTLVVANLVLLTLLIALLHHVFRLTGGRGSATIACMTFLLAFAFAQYVGIGNYNYVCPYSHEMTHGLLSGLSALACAWAAKDGGRAWLVTSGVCLGLAFLTKAEVFLGGAAATLVAVALNLAVARTGVRSRLIDAGSFLSASLIPPILAFALLASAMPARRALIGTVGSWVGVFNPRLVRLPFFRDGIGLNDVSANVRVLIEWFGIYALIAVPSALIGLMLPSSRRIRISASVVAFFVVVGAIWANGLDVEWADVPRPLPLVMLAVAIVSAVGLFQAWKAGQVTDPAMRRLTLAVFAFVLLGKSFLKARIYHYGFVTAMPAALVLVVVSIGWLPSAIERAGGSGGVLRGSASAALIVFVVACLARQAAWRATKIHQVGSAGDAFWADARGPFVNSAVRTIDRQIPRGATLLALPEGIMLNYLARRPTSTVYTNFMPTELVIFGEDRTWETLRSRPADWIALVHKDTSEFGGRHFGRDYGQPIFEWIRDDYRLFAQFGAEPLTTDDFGIVLLRRKAGAPIGGVASPSTR